MEPSMNHIADSSSNNFIAIHTKSDFKIGLAVIDLKLANLVLTQFSDTHDYSNLITKLHTHEPQTILVSNSPFGTSFTNNLKTILKEYFNNVTIVELKSVFFNLKKGLEYINKVCLLDFKTETEINSKPLALAASGALFKYVEYASNYTFVAHSIRLLLEDNENLTLIGMNASRFLELIYNTKNFKGANNLLSVVNYTSTKFGYRSLMSSVLQPSCNLDTILKRQTIIDELLQDKEFLYRMVELIKKFADLESITKNIQMFSYKHINDKLIESKIQCVINMKSIIEMSNQLSYNVMSSNCDTLKQVFTEYFETSKFERLYARISEVIEDPTRSGKNALTLKINKCFAIKFNIVELLDVSRKAFLEMLNDVQRCTDELSESHQLPIKYAYNSTRGFFLQFSLKGLGQNRLDQSSSSVYSTNSLRLLETLPKEFLKVHKTQTSVQFTTEKLLKINSRLNASMSDIYFMSNKLVDDLVQTIQDDFVAFYRLKEFLSLLDVHLSLARYSLSTSGLVKPKFDNFLSLKNSVHPTLQKIKENLNSFKNDNLIVSDEKLVGNTIKLTDMTQFLILTGSNMSGKSTFLKQIGNLQIMAQCGAYVPADDAIFPIKNKILTLSNESTDSLDNNYSSFEREVIEIKNITENLSDNTLILIDEFCKSTNYHEGLAITISTCKQILDHLLEHKLKNVHILFATHFKELSYFESCYSIVKCYHLESMIDDQNQLMHSYSLEKGVCKVQNYGQKILESSALPKSIIEDSKNLLKFFSVNLEEAFEKNELDLKKQLIFNTYNDLVDLANEMDNLTKSEVYQKSEIMFEKFEKEYSKLTI